MKNPASLPRLCARRARSTTYYEVLVGHYVYSIEKTDRHTWTVYRGILPIAQRTLLREAKQALCDLADQFQKANS